MWLNNFYGTEVEIDLPIAYQNGQILISNYEDAEVSEKNSTQTVSNTSYLCKLNSVRSPLLQKSRVLFAVYSLSESVKQTSQGG